MQVRVFESPDMATGLQRIKKELGPDALILSTRTIRSGKLGLLGKPILEITAAIDSDHPFHPEERIQQTTASYSVPPPKANGFHAVVDDSHTEKLNNFSPSEPLVTKPEQEQGLPEQNRENGLQREVNELKDLVRDLAGQIAQVKETGAKQNTRPSLAVRDTEFTETFAGNTIHGDHILSTLINRGINVESARTIAGFLRQSMTDQELSNPDVVLQAMTTIIRDLIQVAPPTLTESETQQRIALIGPTGVGKTTTLAKLAAAHLSKHSSSIALITIDTYRIAAVEQLKVYGEIMRLPVEVVINPKQLQKALDRHHDKELILIDTAGRSPRDTLCIDELGSFLAPELGITNCLVVSATTRETELLDTIDRFNKLNIHSTIFTKIDECANLGVILNVQIQNPSPLAWVTNGQRVPEDLLKITPTQAAELILSNDQGPTHD